MRVRSGCVGGGPARGRSGERARALGKRQQRRRRTAAHRLHAAVAARGARLLLDVVRNLAAAAAGGVRLVVTAAGTANTLGPVERALQGGAGRGVGQRRSGQRAGEGWCRGREDRTSWRSGGVEVLGFVRSSEPRLPTQLHSIQIESRVFCQFGSLCFVFPNVTDEWRHV